MSELYAYYKLNNNNIRFKGINLDKLHNKCEDFT